MPDLYDMECWKAKMILVLSSSATLGGCKRFICSSQKVRSNNSSITVTATQFYNVFTIQYLFGKESSIILNDQLFTLSLLYPMAFRDLKSPPLPSLTGRLLCRLQNQKRQPWALRHATLVDRHPLSSLMTRSRQKRRRKQPRHLVLAYL